MREKSLKDISWQVPEETYREDPALSYSILATYERGGFAILESLSERKETEALTVGSAVDALITGGEQEFNERFVVAEYPDIPDTIIKIVKKCYDLFSTSYRTLDDIPADNLLNIALEFSYQNNWKPETRVKVIREKGADYYNLLFLAENKTLLNTDVYNEVLACVRSLKESESTKQYFAADNPFNDSTEHLYQLKFKATLNNVDYRCMADLIIVDHDNKTIQPVDLKTSSHIEWEFYKSFIQWNYQIQARLYWRIIRDNLDRDPYFKDFHLYNYQFVVINKQSLLPLVWEFPDTKTVGTILVGKSASIQLRDPEEIGKELSHYLKDRPSVPDGIHCIGSNNLTEWLNKYE